MDHFVQSARQVLADRARDRRARAAVAAVVMRAHLPALATALRGECGATEVWLFGSLAEGRFDIDSDCDLAVAGCDARGFGRALALVGSLPVSCDLVRLETASAEMAAIARAGERLV